MQRVGSYYCQLCFESSLLRGLLTTLDTLTSKLIPAVKTGQPLLVVVKNTFYAFNIEQR